MPTNTGEAREITGRANANEEEVIRETKTLTRKVKADLNKEKEPAALGRTNSKLKGRQQHT